VDHEALEFALVHPHQGSTTAPTGVLDIRSSLLQHWRCTGHRSNGKWWWDDLECLLKHSAFLELVQHLLNLITANQRIFLR
jgi:hypothetical protein